MLSNLRRKRVQKLNIEICEGFNNIVGIYWSKDMLIYDAQCTNLGNQRYSNETRQKSFEYYRMAPKRIPYYKVGNEVYNLILCPSGSFRKRSDNKNDQNPIEETSIKKSFLLGETEITQELYQAVMGSKNPSHFGNNPKNPVENVSWYDAVIFCNKLSDMSNLERYYEITNIYRKTIDTIEELQKNYLVETNENSKGFRLPTELGWEYAAKAGTDLLYSGSNNLDEVGWYDGNSKINNRGTTHPVKQLNPNAWGFYDMSGNVWEWCEDKYESANSFSDNRVLRGGSWSDGVSNLGSKRRSYSPNIRNADLGFRVCRYI